MRTHAAFRWLTVGFLLILGACSSSTPNSSDSNSTATSKPDEKKSSSKSIAPPPKPIVIDAGTVFSVTLDQSVSSKTANAGDSFDASLAAPVAIGDKVVLPAGTKANGKVTVAQSAGRFKGHAALALTLNSITVNGTAYPIQTTNVAEASKCRGKRTAVGAGGGAVFGAIVGGLAGGGAGAAIGAAAGAGAGSAAVGFTGKRDISLPAETQLSFKLAAPLSITPK
jgi:hypothetical protein